MGGLNFIPSAASIAVIAMAGLPAPSIDFLDVDLPAVSFQAQNISGVDGDAVTTWSAFGATNTMTSVAGTALVPPVLKVVDGKKLIRFAGTSKMQANAALGATLSGLMTGSNPTDNFSVTCAYRVTQGVSGVARPFRAMLADFRYNCWFQDGVGIVGNNQPRWNITIGTVAKTAPKKLRMNRKSWQVVTWQFVNNGDGTRTVRCYYDGELDGEVTLTLAQWIACPFTQGTAIQFFCDYFTDGSSSQHFEGDVLSLDIHTTALPVDRMINFQKRVMAKHNFYLESLPRLSSTRALIIGVIGDSNSQDGALNGGSAANVTYAERIAAALEAELGTIPIIHNGAIAGRSSFQYALPVPQQNGNGSDVVTGYGRILLGSGFKSPDIVFLQHGTNDLVQGLSDATTRACIGDIIDNLMACQISIVFVNYVPWYNPLAVAQNPRDVNRINKAIYDVVLEKQNKYPNRIFFGATDCMTSISSDEEMTLLYARPGITDRVHPGQRFIDERQVPEMLSKIRPVLRAKGLTA